MTNDRRFAAYTTGLVAVVVGSVYLGAIRQPAPVSSVLGQLMFVGLFAIVELADLSFYDTEETWGLSASEAVLLPMLVTLSFSEVTAAAAIAMMIARARSYRLNPLKEIFNVAQYACAAAVAALTWQTIAGSGATHFGVKEAFAGVVGVLVFASLTHVFVAAGFQLAGRGRFVDALTDVAPAAFVNLGGNIALGLLFAASFVGSRWTIVLFPVALGALYFGYRAVLRQKSERRRMERLHSASRALVGAPDIGTAVEVFLGSTASALSALGARAIVKTSSGFRCSSVYAGETVASMTALAGDEVEGLLGGVGADVVFDDRSVAALFDSGSARNMRAVPIFEEDMPTGLLAVVDRVGADEFGPDDDRFLQALANELALSLQSYRLFDQVTEEREKFELLMEAVTEYAIYMLDPEGRVVSWNQGAERIFDYGAGEIVGRHFSVFYPADDIGSWEAELRRAQREERLELEGWRVRKDGSRFLVNEVVAPVLDDTLQLRGFAKVTRDITEPVRAQKEKEDLTAQLHQSQKLESVGQLAGGIAHDFNNLLSVILNCAHFLEMEVEDGTQVQEDVVQIKDAAQRAAGLTRQLLVFSRRDMIEPRLLDMNEVVEGLQRLLGRTIGEDISIRTSLDPDVGFIKADQSQLEQVLMNLAVNARDAMPGGGSLTIETACVHLAPETAIRYVDLEPGPYVMLRVSDTGHGMSPAVLQKAFDPFFTTKPKGSGTGLGLATVYGIVTGADGHVEVRSEEGLGTSFEILLPERTEETLAAIEAEALVLQGSGETILLVEDEDALRHVAARILVDNGYRVIEARNGRDAIFKMNGGAAIDLLLSDVVMPEMSGLELAGRVREHIPGVKVLLTSGYSSRTFSNTQLDARVLQKPFEPDDLLTVVKEVLEDRALSA